MAAVATPAADQTANLMKNLTLDAQTKVLDAAEATKKPSSIQYGFANGGEGPNAKVPSRQPTLTPLLQEMNQMIDPANMCYLPNGYPSAAYFYGGYDGSEWENYQTYVNHEGVEMPTGVYGDMYHQGYGYASYGAYPSPGSTVPTMGHDRQLYGTHHYQFPAQYYQVPAPSNVSYTCNQAPNSQGEVSTSAAADQPPLSVERAKASQNGTAKGNAKGSNKSVPLKPSHQNPSLTSNGANGGGGVPGGLPTAAYQDPRYGFDGMQSPIPWFDGALFSTGQHRPNTTSSTFSRNSSNFSARNQNQHPLPHLMGLHTQRSTSGMVPAAPAFQNKMYPNNQMYGQFGNTFRTGFDFGSNGYDSRINGRWSVVTNNNYNTRGRGNGYGYGNENLDGFSELNRGPRAGRFNPKTFGPNVTDAGNGQNLSSIAKEDCCAVLSGREQYNRDDFPEKYSDAKFFIIKSYSEDDIHRSIKYSVWASTPNGNKKLDVAYKEAQEKAGECPVFLLFSVNTSGQFVGLAEMVGPVDFDKTMDYWQQDKWFGCFPVKWQIVKDIPNNILKHITLENNDNKPVTNSRDTQEVKLEQGLQMLKLFKEHVNKTSILDDFGFYETRQKLMQEKRVKQQQLQKQPLHAKAVEAIVGEDKDWIHGKPILQKPSESVPDLNEEAAQRSPGEREPFEENGAGLVAVSSPNVAKPATEKPTAANGVVNGC